MKIDPQIREQMDACRPGSVDLALCDLQQLAKAVEQDGPIAAELERSKRFDLQVRAALQDVAVPADLTNRLLATIAATKVESLIPVGSVALVAPSAQGRYISRRRAFFVAGAIAATIVLSLSAWLWPGGQRVVDQQEIVSAITRWQAAANDGTDIAKLPSGFLLPTIDVRPVRQRQFKTAEGWNALAVDYPSPDGKATRLFVVKSPARFNVPSATFVRLPYSTSSGQQMAAWQRGDLLYVLVIPQGSGQQIEQILQPGSIT